jgi:hypothetical protein
MSMTVELVMAGVADQTTPAKDDMSAATAMPVFFRGSEEGKRMERNGEKNVGRRNAAERRQHVRTPENA